jgi:hypothetical protein
MSAAEPRYCPVSTLVSTSAALPSIRRRHGGRPGYSVVSEAAGDHRRARRWHRRPGRLPLTDRRLHPRVDLLWQPGGGLRRPGGYEQTLLGYRCGARRARRAGRLRVVQASRRTAPRPSPFTATSLTSSASRALGRSPRPGMCSPAPSRCATNHCRTCRVRPTYRSPGSGVSTDGLVCLVCDVMNNQPRPPAQTQLAYESVNEGSSWSGGNPPPPQPPQGVTAVVGGRFA